MSVPRPRKSSRPLAAILVASLLTFGSVAAQAQQLQDGSTAPRALPIGVPTSPLQSAVKSFTGEMVLYGSDSVALLKSPLRWDHNDWATFGGAAFLVGALFMADKDVHDYAQTHRTPLSDGVADVTKRFGLEYAYGIPIAMTAGGIVFKNERVRDTGRDALEAALISGLLTNAVLKPLIGRNRPEETNGETSYRFLRSDASFPSGHATQAFAVASVFAARSKGWVVPTISYTLATIVALDRMNDDRHFSSDVLAGAVIGTAVGQFIVKRHARPEDPVPTTKLELVPIGGGLAMKLSF